MMETASMERWLAGFWLDGLIFSSRFCIPYRLYDVYRLWTGPENARAVLRPISKLSVALVDENNTVNDAKLGVLSLAQKEQNKTAFNNKVHFSR